MSSPPVPHVARYGPYVDPAERALAGASKSLREAIYAHDRWMEHVEERDLPVPALEALQRAVDALSDALERVEACRDLDA